MNWSLSFLPSIDWYILLVNNCIGWIFTTFFHLGRQMVDYLISPIVLLFQGSWYLGPSPIYLGPTTEMQLKNIWVNSFLLVLLHGFFSFLLGWLHSFLALFSSCFYASAVEWRFFLAVIYLPIASVFLVLLRMLPPFVREKKYEQWIYFMQGTMDFVTVSLSFLFSEEST